jgi:hypothetical protein
VKSDRVKCENRRIPCWFSTARFTSIILEQINKSKPKKNFRQKRRTVPIPTLSLLGLRDVAALRARRQKTGVSKVTGRFAPAKISVLCLPIATGLRASL